MNSNLQAADCRVGSRGGLLRRIVMLLQVGAAATLLGCGGASPPDAQDLAGAAAPPARLATNGAPITTITTVLPPEVRPGNLFGWRAVLRDNGNTLIVAASGDTLNPNTGQIDKNGPWGSVHILARTGGGPWQQTALLRPTAGPEDHFAWDLAVSGDGNTIAVGARLDRSRGSGIGSDPLDRAPWPIGCDEPDPYYARGAVWVYVKQGGTWQLREFIKAAQPARFDSFGYSVALSHDGNSLAVGAVSEGGPQFTGAVHLFRRDAFGRWALADHIKASNAAEFAAFGYVVRLSADGRVLAVAAIGESSADCRIDGNQSDTSSPWTGAAYVFERTPEGRMQQRAYIKACDRPGENRFGSAMAMNPAGDLLVVGAPLEDAQTLSSHSMSDAPAPPAVGRAYVFTRAGAGWVRSGALGSSNAATGDRFGSGVKMSADASTLAIGAPGEDSALTGVNPPQDEDFGSDDGAIYVFRRGADGSYAQTHYVKPPRLPFTQLLNIGDDFVNGLDLSEDGSVLAVGVFRGEAPLPDDHSTGAGAVHVYDGLF